MTGFQQPKTLTASPFYKSPMTQQIEAQQAKLSAQYKKAETDASIQKQQYTEANQEALTTWKQNHVEVRPNEWITKADYQKLQDYDNQYNTNFINIAKTQGIDTVNKAMQNTTIQTHISSTPLLTPVSSGDYRLKDGNYITKAQYNDIMKLKNGGQLWTILYNYGVDEYNKLLPYYDADPSIAKKVYNELVKGISIEKQIEKQAEQFQADNVILGDNTAISKTEFEMIQNQDKETKTNFLQVLQDKGYEAYTKAIDDYNYNNLKAMGDAIGIDLQKIADEKGYDAAIYKYNLNTTTTQFGETIPVSLRSNIKLQDHLNGTDFYTILNKQGIEAYNKAVNDYNTQQQKAYDDFMATHVKIDRDLYVPKDFYNVLSPKQIYELKTYGSYTPIQLPNNIQSISDVKNSTFFSDKTKEWIMKGIEQGSIVKPYDWTKLALTVDEIKASPTLTIEAKKVLLNNIESGKLTAPKAIPYTLEEIIAGKNINEKTQLTLLQGINEGTIKPKIVKSSITPASIGIFTAELLVPAVYLARHWGEMSNTERALNIGLDALFFAPVIGAAGKGARTVSVAGQKTTIPLIGLIGKEGKAISVVSKGATQARILAATKAGSNELMRQIFFPVEFAKNFWAIGTAKPVKAIQGGKVVEVTGARASVTHIKNIIDGTAGRIKASLSSIETIVHPRKLPESVVTDIFHTIKIPVSKFSSVEEGFRWRDKMIKAASKSGNSIVIESGDSLITLKRSPLMRELSGGLAHATPDGTAFVNGLVVEFKKGLPLIEQGLYFSPEITMRFANMSAFGVVGKAGKTVPAVYIASPELAKKATTTSKIYKNVLEGEAKFNVGVNLPKPQQVLFTRMGDTGVKVNLLLTKRLTVKQIAKLKAEGLIKAITNLYQPSINITSKTGKVLTPVEIEKLAGIIGDTDKGLARNIRTIANEPEGLVRVWQRITSPSAYRISSTTRDNKVQVGMTEITRKANETGQQYLARINNEVNRGIMPSTEVKEFAEYSKTAIKDSPSRVSSQTKDPTRLTIVPSRIAEDNVPRVPPEKPVVPVELPRPRSPIARHPDREEYRIPPPEKGKFESKNSSVLLPDIELDKKQTEVPDGSIAWKRGAFYDHIPPPWTQDKPITTKVPPVGFKLKGKTPAETVQMIGQTNARVPKEFSIDMGVVDIFVTDHGKNIKFKGHGLKTKVGKGSSKTKGMTQGLSVVK